MLSRIGVIVAGVLLAACGGDGGPRLEPSRGVILISIDTLRADHLGTYGYERDTSPFLDGLASEGVVFEHAYAQLPGTLSSHMSIFTGLYPGEHGVYAPDGVLPAQILTLPEILQRNGFRTAGFTEGGYVDGHFGFSRGFDEFSDEKQQIYSDLKRTVARGLDFLRTVDDEDRFFLFLHSYVVHDPYFPPEPYASRYWPGPKPETFSPTGPNLVKYNRGKLTATETDVQYFKALYDGSIRYMDGVLAGFFTEVQQLGLLSDTTIIITSDHGEEFTEHGKLVHQQIYDETLHVPLIVVGPGLKPHRVHAMVESIDIAPTVLDLAAIEHDGRLSGESLKPLMLEAPRDIGARQDAYAEMGRDDLRTIFHRSEAGRLSQLLYYPPKNKDAVLWVEQEVGLDVVQNPFRFRAWAYHEPRTLTVALADGGQEWQIDLPAEEWREVAIDLPPGGPKWSVTLSSPGCSPFESETGQKLCLSVQVVGAELVRMQLFDLTHDPATSEDLSARAPSLMKTLLRKLATYERDAVAGEERQQLDSDLQERLKALGYLQ